MTGISVVVITKNEAANIAACIQSARQIADDIIVVDSGSCDDTVRIAQHAGASVFQISWQGFGFSRNFGAAKARNNWIFALDADERISQALASAVCALDLSDPLNIYRFTRTNHIADARIRFGTLGYEKVTRLYHRTECRWDLSPVHEKLVSRNSVEKIRLHQHIDHFGLSNITDYREKSKLYARLSAEKYFLEGRKVNSLKKFTSPFFNAVKSYIFQFGFLEGRRGLAMGQTVAYYCWLKYAYLHQLQHTRVVKAAFSKQITLQPAAETA